VTHFVFAADERICKGKPQSTALVFSNVPTLDIRAICIELYLVLDGQINKGLTVETGHFHRPAKPDIPPTIGVYELARTAGDIIVKGVKVLAVVPANSPVCCGKKQAAPLVTEQPIDLISTESIAHGKIAKLAAIVAHHAIGMRGKPQETSCIFSYMLKAMTGQTIGDGIGAPSARAGKGSEVFVAHWGCK
jgi:hypothetical protein